MDRDVLAQLPSCAVQVLRDVQGLVRGARDADKTPQEADAAFLQAVQSTYSDFKALKALIDTKSLLEVFEDDVVDIGKCLTDIIRHLRTLRDDPGQEGLNDLVSHDIRSIGDAVKSVINTAESLQQNSLRSVSSTPRSDSTPPISPRTGSTTISSPRPDETLTPSPFYGLQTSTSMLVPQRTPLHPREDSSPVGSVSPPGMSERLTTPTESPPIPQIPTATYPTGGFVPLPHVDNTASSSASSRLSPVGGPALFMHTLDAGKITTIARTLAQLSELVAANIATSVLRSKVGTLAAEITKHSFELQVAAKLVRLSHYSADLKTKTTGLLHCLKGVLAGQTEAPEQLEATIKDIAVTMRELVRAASHIGVQIVNMAPQAQPHSPRPVVPQPSLVAIPEDEELPVQPSAAPASAPEAPSAAVPDSPRSPSSSPTPPQEAPISGGSAPSPEESPSTRTTRHRSMPDQKPPPPDRSTTPGSVSDGAADVDSDHSNHSNYDSASESADDDAMEDVIDDILDTLDEAYNDLVDRPTPPPSSPRAHAESQNPRRLAKSNSMPSIPVIPDLNAPPQEGLPPTEPPIPTITPPVSAPPLLREHKRWVSQADVKPPSGPPNQRATITGEGAIPRLSVSGPASVPPPSDQPKKKSKTANALKSFFKEAASMAETMKDSAMRRMSMTNNPNARKTQAPMLSNPEIAERWEMLEQDIYMTDTLSANARNRWEVNNQKKLEREQRDMVEDTPLVATDAKPSAGDELKKKKSGIFKTLEKSFKTASRELRKSAAAGIAFKRQYSRDSLVGCAPGSGPTSPVTTLATPTNTPPASPSPSRHTIDKAGGTTPRKKTNLILEEVTDPRAAKFEEPDDEQNVRFAGADNSQLIGATISKLIQRLTHHSFANPVFMEVFLLTYRAFLTPKELLELIELRWNTRPPPGFDLEEFKDTRLLPIRLRIYNVLKTWLEKFSHDFDTDLVNALEALSKKMEAHGSATSGQTLQRMIAKFREGASYLSKQLMLSEPPEPILPEQVASILDLHPLEVARQLTVEEYRLFKKIQPFELLNLSWTKKDKELTAPNVLAMIRFTNHVSQWICSEILTLDEAKERALKLNRFIMVAQRCLELGNFNSCMEIVSALHHAAIFRLQTTWNLLPDDTWTLFERLEDLFLSDDNFKNYRTAVERALPPCLPYLGRYLSDLLFVEEKFPNVFAGTELINYGKLETIAGIIQNLQLQQENQYTIKEVPEIIKYVQEYKTVEDKALYQLSLQREARKKS